MSPAFIPVLDLLVDWLKERRFIKRDVLPLIDAAMVMQETKDRRELVVAELINRGLTESNARFLTEKGVRMWKKQEAKRLKKLAKLAAKEAR